MSNYNILCRIIYEHFINFAVANPAEPLWLINFAAIYITSPNMPKNTYIILLKYIRNFSENT